jgi:site-specific DNA-methyltransferase (adenine-specific)
MLDIESITNTIINDDCMNVLKQLPDKCIDAIICDLPYGLMNAEWDNVIPFDKLWEQYKRIRKENAPIILFGTEPFSTYLRMSNIKEFKYDWIWDKKQAGNVLNAKKQPLKTYEIISVFGTTKYFPIMRQGIFRKKGGCNKKSVLTSDSILGYFDYNDLYYPTAILTDFSNANKGNKIHPTQKPVKLIEYLIKTYSNEGDLILDNCSGSGTTAVACHNLKRRFICIERDIDYYNASVERLENAQAQMRLF